MINQNLYLNSHWQQSKPASTREGFGNALVVCAQKFPRLVVLTADLAESTQVEKFHTQYPNRFFDVGVAEQNLAGISAGLAATGFTPVACSYAMFSPGRNWEQMRNSIGYGNCNVKITSTHAGLSVGPDGATHQALEDIALTRVIPNFVVISPMDYEQAYRATQAMLDYQGPVYLRLNRPASPLITTSQTPFVLGKAQTLRFGESVTIVATGLMVAESLKAAEEIDAEVINVHTIKPLDINSIIQSLKKTGKLIVAEEHQIAGGLGSAITENLAEMYPVPTRFIAVRDQFGQSAESADKLFEAYSLTWQHIIKTAQSF